MYIDMQRRYNITSEEDRYYLRRFGAAIAAGRACGHASRLADAGRA